MEPLFAVVRVTELDAKEATLHQLDAVVQDNIQAGHRPLIARSPEILLMDNATAAHFLANRIAEDDRTATSTSVFVVKVEAQLTKEVSIRVATKNYT